MDIFSVKLTQDSDIKDFVFTLGKYKLRTIELLMSLLNKIHYNFR